MKYRRFKKTAAFFMAATLLSVSCPLGLAETTGIVMEVQAADHGAWVSDGTVGDFSYTIYDNGCVVIDGYNGNTALGTEITVPTYAEGKRVTNVYLGSVYNAGGIVKVTIPEGVECIEGSGFSGFSGLTEINLPSTLTEIGAYAFDGCSSLSNIRIPDGVTSMGEEIFAECRSLETVNIPAEMTEIGRQFRGSSIKSIVIPGTISRIGDYAFADCAGLKNVTISEGVAEIGESAFSESGITSLTIPGSVKKIGAWAFYSCGFLTTLTLQNGVGRIDSYAFGSCSGLKSVTIPGSVGIIGSFAFGTCKGITDVVIQEGVTTIGMGAFDGCDSLSTITIPDSVTTIEDGALGFNQIHVLCNENSYAYQYLIQAGFKGSDTQSPNSTPSNSAAANPFPAGSTRVVSGGIYVSLGNGQAAYKTPANKKTASAKILDSLKVEGKSYKVTQINGKAFSGCSKLKKITVQAKSLKKVGKKAFKGIHKKAVIKVPKAKLKAYKKLFKGKGQAKSVKIRK